MAEEYSKNERLNELIARACSDTQPNTRARNEALKQIKWRLAVQGFGAWVEVRGVQAMADITRHESMAAVFTGLDNEEMKRDFFQAVLKLALEVEVLS